jgi:hypothetical protein
MSSLKKWHVSVFFLLFISLVSSCGTKEEASKPPSTNDPRPTPRTPTSPISGGAINPEDEYWSGYVTECVANVEKKDQLDNYIKLKYDLKCSPVLKAKSQELLSELIVSWVEKNCPANADINGVESCRFAHQPSMFTTNTKTSPPSAEKCAPQRGRQYGQLTGDTCQLSIGTW